jgi:hypothetical protein
MLSGFPVDIPAVVLESITISTESDPSAPVGWGYPPVGRVGRMELCNQLRK